MENESKRQFLKGLSALLGASVVGQFASNNSLAAAFSYQSQNDGTINAGNVFSLEQMKTLKEVCNVVLPQTDTPSAAQLDVHGFLDHQLKVCHSIDEQKSARQVINKIEQQSLVHYSIPYYQLSFTQQTTLLVALEQQKMGFTESDKQQFKALKALMVFGYFTTEVGATQVLNYQAVPGGFKGSVDYSSLKKSWGSLGFY